MKKYEFTGEAKDFCGVELHRIRALKDFGDVAAGDLGGWIKGEGNLSHDGRCWVSDDARVFGDARVYGNAWVAGDAQVFGDARVYGNARVSDDARVSGNARVSDDARVYDDARVLGDARVFGNARGYGNAWVAGDAQVFGNARVSDDARVYDDARVSDDARVFGDARVYGNAWVAGDAEIKAPKDTFWLSAIGSRYGTTTFFRCVDGKVRVTCGCFYGDLDEFLAKVEKTHGDNKHGKVYKKLIELAKIQMEVDV